MGFIRKACVQGSGRAAQLVEPSLANDEWVWRENCGCACKMANVRRKMEYRATSCSKLRQIAGRRVNRYRSFCKPSESELLACMKPRDQVGLSSLQ